MLYTAESRKALGRVVAARARGEDQVSDIHVSTGTGSVVVATAGSAEDHVAALRHGATVIRAHGYEVLAAQCERAAATATVAGTRREEGL